MRTKKRTVGKSRTGKCRTDNNLRLSEGGKCMTGKCRTMAMMAVE